jgi:SAM-dependent methyltransferase
MISWEQAVQSLIADPSTQPLVKACYFDSPVGLAAERFWKSTEWKAVSSLLPSKLGKALDLGAGRGISAYALARDGWDVTALEPDPSPLVGAGAIKQLIEETQLPIAIKAEYSECLPFKDSVFDLVHCRQALHHANDLELTCKEISRVLRSGGIFVATREHVITHQDDLGLFLAQHPLHNLYGGENAYQLKAYKKAICDSGLKLIRVIQPYDSPINYFPATEQQVDDSCTRLYYRFLGKKLAGFVLSDSFVRTYLATLGRIYANFRNNSPGRLYSFVAVKP